MTFEPGKEHKIRDGRRARVYAAGEVGHNAIHGAFWIDHRGSVHRIDPNGACLLETVEPPSPSSPSPSTEGRGWNDPQA